MCSYTSLSSHSTIDGEEVQGSAYKDGLKELMDICTLCNDSGLAYNEVRLASNVQCSVFLSIAIYNCKQYPPSVLFYFDMGLGWSKWL